jgi:hypothetical protein
MVCEIDDTSSNSNLLEPIYVSSNESEDGHHMDWSDRVGYSTGESGVGVDGNRNPQINPQTATENVESLDNVCPLQSPANFAVLYPDRSMLMNVVISESESESESEPNPGDDIYVSDMDSIPPLAVYIPDSDEDGETDGQSTEDLDFGVPLAVYVPGADAADPIRASGSPNHAISSLVRDPFTGQYTADSFSGFQEEWLD